MKPHIQQVIKKRWSEDMLASNTPYRADQNNQSKWDFEDDELRLAAIKAEAKQKRKTAEAMQDTALDAAQAKVKASTTSAVESSKTARAFIRWMAILFILTIVGSSELFKTLGADLKMALPEIKTYVCNNLIKC